MDQEYFLKSQIYNQSGLYTCEINCSDWVAVNLGDTPVQVDNVFLLPRSAPGLAGSSFSPDGRKGEIYKNGGAFTVTFIAPMGTEPSVQIIQKIYP